MQKLFAEFEVELPGNCLYAFPDAIDISYAVPFGDFEVQLLLPIPKGFFNRGGEDQNWIGSLHHVHVLVSREEVQFPPPVIPDSDGRRDYGIQLSYLRSAQPPMPKQRAKSRTE